MRCMAATPFFVRIMPELALLAYAPAWCTLTSCTPTDTPSTPPIVIDAAPVRNVRVLVGRGVERVRLRAARGGSVLDDDGAVLYTFPAGEWVVAVATQAGGVALGGRTPIAKTVTAIPDSSEPVLLSVLRGGEWSEGTPYPGGLRISATAEGYFDVINLADVERYVECVVAGEVWPTFATEAYRAQAVIARTYVLYQMHRRQRADWDISATPGSQVYGGLREDEVGRLAAGATAYSRGVVCTWKDQGEDRLFSTYYSSVCGGMSQSAEIFGTDDTIAPLAGGVRCDYCKTAPKGTYRWGPVSLDLHDLRTRLLARYPKLASLGEIAKITVVESVSGGASRRAVRLRLADSSGHTHDILAERFRLAVGANVMRSTDCDIRLAAGKVIFEHGRGYGHGLGLCQWGMQGQALAGKRAGEIIRHYYPGARLTRVY